MSSGFEQRSTARKELMDKRSLMESPKSSGRSISKSKSQQRLAGVDGQSLAAIEVNLKDNLYKIWNRMSSGIIFHRLSKG